MNSTENGCFADNAVEEAEETDLPTKWAGHISRERFDTESPYFTWISIKAVVYSHTRYDVTCYFWSDVIAKKLSKMPPLMALCGTFVVQHFALPNQLVGFLLWLISVGQTLAACGNGDPSWIHISNRTPTHFVEFCGVACSPYYIKGKVKREERPRWFKG